MGGRACQSEAGAQDAVSGRRPGRRPRRSGSDVAAGFLGAVTALGMAVLLFLGTVAVAFLIARTGDGDATAVAARVLSDTVRLDVLGALLLSSVVLGAFFAGGYVAARVGRREGRRQALAVWLWTLAAPIGLTLTALAGGSLGRAAITAVRYDPSALCLAAALIALGLLGALLGGETGQRARRRAADLTVALALCAEFPDHGAGSRDDARVPVPAGVVPAR
jgi:hypothetical protein